MSTPTPTHRAAVEAMALHEEREARAALHDQWALIYEPGTAGRARHERCAQQFRALTAGGVE